MDSVRPTTVTIAAVAMVVAAVLGGLIGLGVAGGMALHESPNPPWMFFAVAAIFAGSVTSAVLAARVLRGDAVARRIALVLFALAAGLSVPIVFAVPLLGLGMLAVAGTVVASLTIGQHTTAFVDRQAAEKAPDERAPDVSVTAFKPFLD